MSKASGALGAVGKVITYILVVLLVLGIAGGIAYFALRSQGVTYYVEYGGEVYLANGDGGNITLWTGETHEFSVKSLTGGEVNFDVKVVSNSSNNFTFTCNGKVYQFVSTEEKNNDYSEIFGLQKSAGGFSLSFPDGFTVEQAIKEKFGGDITLIDELSDSTAYFVVTVSVGKSSVDLSFVFGGQADISSSGIVISPPQIVF